MGDSERDRLHAEYHRLSHDRGCPPGCGWLDDWDAHNVPFLKPITMEAVLIEPNPELIALMTGMKIEDGKFVPMHDAFAIEVHARHPVPRRAWRVVWEWLTRKPRQYTDHVVLIPNARFLRNEE